MQQNNAKNTSTVALDWQQVTPQFRNETLSGYFARLRREFLIWRANPICRFRNDGTVWRSYYPLSLEEWSRSFGEWLNVNAAPGLLDLSEVHPEPTTPIAYSFWIEYISEPERAAHWHRCKAAYEEAEDELD